MVLNTKNEIDNSVKIEENFGVIFEKTNAFQNYITSEVLNLNLDTFDKMMKWVKTPDNPGGVLSKQLALIKGLKMTDEDIVLNAQYMSEELKKDDVDVNSPMDAGI